MAAEPRPKILRIVTRLNIGGPAIHTVLLTREMRAFGFETLLVVGSCEGDDGDMSYIVDQSDPVFVIPEMSRSVRPGRNLIAFWKMFRLLRRERPLIVHTHTAMAGCLGRAAAILARVPIVVHTFHGNSLRQYFSPIMSRMFLGIERALARRTAAICVVSEQQANELSLDFKVARREQFRVMPLGLDLEPFLSLPAATGPAGILRVGWLGRLVPVKDVPLLVKVIDEAVRRIPGIEFIVAGDGPDAPLMREVAGRHPGAVKWLGWLEDVGTLIGSCHVMIQTSLNEGTPVALIQAMAAGRPFVSTPVGGVVDMVKPAAAPCDGKSRWFDNAVLAPADATSFVDALESLSRERDLLTRMGASAKDLAQARYRKDLLAANMDALYREVIAAGNARLKPDTRTVSGV